MRKGLNFGGGHIIVVPPCGRCDADGEVSKCRIIRLHVIGCQFTNDSGCGIDSFLIFAGLS